MRIDSDDGTGWGVIRVDQLPNVRALHICEMYAPGLDWPACFDQLATMARACGCSEVRCSAQPAQVRLYQRFHEWEPVYTTMRMRI